MVLPLLFLACSPATSTLVESAPDALLPALQVERTDGVAAYGPPVGEARVWSVDRAWSDTDAAPGLAWGASSGLDWDEKYRAWVASLPSTPSVEAHDTAALTTPWGRTLPLGRLECAETAIVLRATFAAWHGLPFYLSGYSPALGRNVYYGHFGMVISDGTPVHWSPDFANYADHTDAMDASSDPVGSWIDDPVLETRALTAQHDDANEFLGTDAFAGAYFDEIHANKRVGHFLMHLLTDFGSIHLAHATNVFDLEAEATDAGDVLIHRWQAQGVGHTMVVKSITDDPDGTLDVEMLAGNMPRVQPRWMSAPVSATYFSHRHAGSEELDGDGTPFVEHGGGIKRWRSAENIGGRWKNRVPVTDEDDWILASDDVTLAARVPAFEALLGEVTPEGRRDALLAAIDAARDALRSHPSSCTNRTRREDAFDDLYAHMESAFGWTRAEVDATYRTHEDYVFAELDYDVSPTCCWNSTTGTMHAIIMDFAAEEQQAADDQGTCVEPTTFRMREGGYAPFSQHAAALGQGGDWVTWSADEDCPQAGAEQGAVLREPFSDYCDLQDAPADEPPVDDEPDPNDPVDTPDATDESGGGCGGSVALFSLLGDITDLFPTRTR